jgi:hypothetical protein
MFDRNAFYKSRGTNPIFPLKLEEGYTCRLQGEPESATVDAIRELALNQPEATTVTAPKLVIPTVGSGRGKREFSRENLATFLCGPVSAENGTPGSRKGKGKNRTEATEPANADNGTPVDAVVS